MAHRANSPGPGKITDVKSRRLHYRLRRERYQEMKSEERGVSSFIRDVLGVLEDRDQKISDLTKEKEQLRNLAIRARADLENARKRFQREKEETIKFANEKLVRELILVVDNLERALASSSETSNAQAIYEGVKMVLDQLLSMLRAHGVEVIESDGKKFDPHFHEAVTTEEREDVEENQIIETFQKGYILSGRVIRPAMVKVARAASRPVAAAAGAEKTPDPDSEETLADFDDLPKEKAQQPEAAGENQAAGGGNEKPPAVAEEDLQETVSDVEQPSPEEPEAEDRKEAGDS